MPWPNLLTGDVNDWSCAQIERRFDVSLAAIAETWASSGTKANMNDHFAQMVFDQISDEFDIHTPWVRRATLRAIW